jgi:hypothetical protein
MAPGIEACSIAAGIVSSSCASGTAGGTADSPHPTSPVIEIAKTATIRRPANVCDTPLPIPASTIDLIEACLIGFDLDRFSAPDLRQTPHATT